MRLFRVVAPSAVLAGCCFSHSNAHAQFTTPTSRFVLFVPGGARNSASFGLYPLAAFNTGGINPDGTAGTDTVYGGLISFDYGFKAGSGDTTVELGGWLFTRGEADLYELHARAFVTPDVGVQLGYLASSRTSGTAMDAFVVYELSSRKRDPNAAKPWGIHFGAGAFIDFAGGRTTTDFTTFVSASVEIDKNWSVNGSMWYLRDRALDANRFALGLGYRF